MKHAWKWIRLAWMAGIATLFLDLVGRVPECTLRPVPVITPVRAILALLALSYLAWKAGRESY